RTTENILTWDHAIPSRCVGREQLPLAAIRRPSLWVACRGGLITNIPVPFRLISWAIPSLLFRPIRLEVIHTTPCMGTNLASPILSFVFRSLQQYYRVLFPFCRFITSPVLHLLMQVWLGGSMWYMCG